MTGEAITTDERCRPVLFSAPMVRAILEGRKTQTRRIVKDTPPFGESVKGVEQFEHGWHWIYGPTGRVCSPIRGGCRYGKPGDLLWVRETHYVWSAGYRDGSGRRIDYRATEPDAPCTWTPSIHMPRWASRIMLRVTDVRVERLQDISETDAQAEGAEPADCCLAHYHGYRNLWEKINGRGSWDTNPWVWVVAFERVAYSMRAAA